MSKSYTGIPSSLEMVQLVIQKLPSVFDLQTFNSILNENVPEEFIGIIQASSIQKKRLPIKWERKGIDLYTLKAKKLSLYHILEAWTQERCYLSHHSALVEHKLLEREKVNEVYLSQDLHVRLKESKNIDQNAMKKSFSHGPRISSCYGMLKERKIYFIEKKIGGKGVIKKSVRGKSDKFQLRVTNIERTLLDSAISPFYSGGISAVMMAFKNANIDIEQLASIYKSLSLTYPYWQRVGFLLDQCGKKELSDKWLNIFGEPQMNFFLDHNYNDNWRIDMNWKMFHPPLE